MASSKRTAIKRARNKKTKAEAETINSLSEQPDEDLPLSPGDRLCEDELIIIFNSYWISTKDLLNFRLVSKNWRDATTTTLLQRDACYVTLEIPTVEDGAGDGVESCGWSLGDKTETLKTPQILTELMSNSPKFPVSNFHIDASHLTDYADFPDLLLFFKLHGEKVKSLSHFGEISQQKLFNICFLYAPKLECLDLSCEGTMRVSLENEDNDKRTMSKWTSKLLPIKSIIFGHHGVYYNNYNAEAYQAFLHFLLSQSNLSRIDVKLSQLAHVLQEGKEDLSIALVTKYLELSPKLSKLSLNLIDFELKKTTLAPINALIRSSRNTLHDLNLEYRLILIEQGAKFKIPRIKHLKKLTLSGYIHDLDILDSKNLREVCHLFQFTDGTSGKKYFPSLLTVRIEVGSPTIKTSLASFLDDSPENCFSNVDMLEMESTNQEKNWLKNFKLHFTTFLIAFPNLRMLQFECVQIRQLRSSLWMLHSLEFIEIYGISKERKAPADFRLVPFVDKFFTGFSIDWCQKFQNKKVPKHVDNPRTLKSLQVRPSICDLPNLKELKLKFSADFSVQFASKITADYAFSKMPDTKFIVSYDPDKINQTADVPKRRKPRGYDSDDSSDSDDSFLENVSDSDDDYCKYWNCGRKIDEDSGENINKILS